MRSEACTGDPALILVEDDPDDLLLVTRALLRLNQTPRFGSVRDGVELLEHLAERRTRSLPELVLLDLNMPRMDGREVLAHLKCDVFLKRIPVVVLTTSSDARERSKVLALGAADHFSKPEQFSAIQALLEAIVKRWLTPASTTRKLP